MGILIGVAVGVVAVGVLIWLFRSGMKAQAEMEAARRHGLRREATVRSWAALPRSSGTYNDSRGPDRRHFYLTIHIEDGDDYQATCVWKVNDETALEEGGRIPVTVHRERPDVVWPEIRALEYDLGDYASKYYRRRDGATEL